MKYQKVRAEKKVVVCNNSLTICQNMRDKKSHWIKVKNSTLVAPLIDIFWLRPCLWRKYTFQKPSTTYYACSLVSFIKLKLFNTLGLLNFVFQLEYILTNPRSPLNFDSDDNCLGPATQFVRIFCTKILFKNIICYM